MENKRRYSGFIRIRNYGEADDVLFLDGDDLPLADILQDEISGKVVTARYWITDQKCTRDEAVEEFVKRLHGCAECKFVSHYSEITGYLWTDEEINIGGHDLLSELSSHVDKFLILEVDIAAPPSLDRCTNPGAAAE